MARLTRRAVLQGTGAAAACVLPSAHADAGAAILPAGGVNLAGADFGNIPGRHGTEYLYPPARHFDYFRSLGFTLVRLPFKWERLQPELNAPFAPDELTLLTAAVRNASRNGQVIIDPHNYAKRRIAADGWTKEHIIGSGEVPVAAFADFWSRLSTQFKDDEHVLFGLMNEPAEIELGAWLQAANAAVAAIRAAGATNLILVPGVAFTGAHSWNRVGNVRMAEIVDPAGNFAFDVHQYFDPDSSGTKPDAVSGTIGSERIEAFQQWARQHGFRAVLGEFNGGRNPASYNALNDLCQEMTANADVWLGWAAWAGGPRWPENEMFNLEPWHDGRMREQTALLARYASAQPFHWVADGAAIDLDFARNRFHGAPSPDPRRETVELPLNGPIASLLRENAFTLVVETRAIATNPAACDLVTMNGHPLLRRAADGALELEGDTPLRTAAQPLSAWQAKRRLAIALDRSSRRVTIGVTGAKAVAALAEPNRTDRVAINAQAGTIRRITLYPKFMDTAALDALLA